MKLQTALRAFLAARFPCAFEEPILLSRLNRSGAMDEAATAEQLHASLVTLSGRFRDAECLVDTDGTVAWSATAHGVAVWKEQGSPAVGG